MKFIVSAHSRKSTRCKIWATRYECLSWVTEGSILETIKTFKVFKYKPIFNLVFRIVINQALHEAEDTETPLGEFDIFGAES
jgi:hypothetical protein